MHAAVPTPEAHAAAQVITTPAQRIGLQRLWVTALSTIRLNPR
jgi:hypothetical protein